MKKDEKILLNAKKRTVFGKKLKALRKNGIIPGNVYGEGMKSEALEMQFKEFAPVFKKAGETHIVYLNVESDEKDLPVLIKDVQLHPVSDIILHVDFRKVNLKKKIETDVPLHFVNDSDAVTQNKGVLLTLAENIKVEALPEEIPQEIEIDISLLKELNDEIKIKDLKAATTYVFIDDPEKVLVRISEHKEEEVTPQIVAPETVEITTERKDEEVTAEGEAEAPEEKAPKKEKE